MVTDQSFLAFLAWRFRREVASQPIDCSNSGKIVSVSRRWPFWSISNQISAKSIATETVSEGLTGFRLCCVWSISVWTCLQILLLTSGEKISGVWIVGNWQGQNRQICILKFQAHIVGLLYAFFDAVPKDQARDCLIFVCGWFGDGLQVALGVAYTFAHH